MVCDFCHERNAVIFLEQVSNNGQKRKINMCMECAVERGVSTDPKSIESSIGSLFKEIALNSRKIQQENNRLCPVCGTRLAEIKKSRRTGCPECYAIFKNEINSIFNARNITPKYTGSMPSRLSSFRSVLTDRIALQNKLDAAVADENYEKAAMYRDFLRALEKESVAPSEDKEGLD